MLHLVGCPCTALKPRLCQLRQDTLADSLRLMREKLSIGAYMQCVEKVATFRSPCLDWELGTTASEDHCSHMFLGTAFAAGALLVGGSPVRGPRT